MRKTHFGLAVLMTLALVGCNEKKPAVKADTRQLVRVGAVTNGVEFADALRVQGAIRAKEVASIAARVPGTIDILLVDEGSPVKQGETLFKVDQVNLANAVRAARDDLAMAKAKLAQAEATTAKAKLDVERMSRLVKEGAVTQDMFEKAEVADKSYGAALDAAKAMVTKAETGLAVAEKNFADSEVRAPFDGVITKKHKHAGDFCGAGMKVFDLENSAAYELCIALNSDQYGRVKVGETKLEFGSTSKAITYKSPSVNPLTRTFEVRAVVPKTSAIAAGMLIDCRVIFNRRKSQAVPSGAIATRENRDCLFKVVGGKVVSVPVTPGLASNGMREIISPRLSPDDAIIVEGMLLVNEGDLVRTK